MVKFSEILRTRIISIFSAPNTGRYLAAAGKICVLIAIVALLPVVLQFLHVLDLQSALEWKKTFPGPYKVNTAIVIVLLLAGYCVFNSLSYAATAVVILCFTFSLADMQKMRILHQPLLPGDLLFFQQALLVTRMYVGGILIGLSILSVIIFLTVWQRRRLLHCRLNWKPRLLFCTAVTGTLLSIAGNFHSVIQSTNNHYNIVDEFWSQLSNYNKNGVLYAFLLNIESLRINRPDHYSRESIERLLAPFAETPDSDSAKPALIHPDVIIYMNESFWDVTRLTSVKPPCDPIPNFHKLCKKNKSITLYSPVFGGNTCDAEFEVLTGMSNGFFPQGTRAYNQFIQRPIPSLVRVFKENGYRTTAIHTFKRWFWNRGNVYRHLGFDAFISMENLIEPEVKGMYIGDRELSRQIINQLDSAGDSPRFIFALSMQNHGPYEEGRYDSLDCPATTGMSAPANNEYNTYVQGLTDADRSLKQLADYIKRTSRPTILFFFGDHLPGFVHVYKESGFEERIKENNAWAYSTRGVWCANRALPPQRDTAITMAILPLIVARMAHLSVPPYYRFIDEIRTRIPISSRRNISAGRQAPRAATAAAQGQTEDPRWQIIYDVLFGKGYSSKYHHLGTIAAPPAAAAADSTRRDTVPAAQ